METKSLLPAAFAAVVWGSGYYVTQHFLPADHPLFGATVRALPFGLLLLALRRRLPHGIWWWRAGLLGLLNVGVFFVLVYVAATHLPGGLAATLTASAPILTMLLAWGLVSERPHPASLVAAVVGIAGVALLVLRADAAPDPVGIAAAFGAVACFALGTVLSKRWRPPVDLLTFTSWQLVLGGLALVPVTLLVEGAPPALDLRAVGGFLWVGGLGAAVAYAAWFHSMSRAPAAGVALVGLLNPVAGSVIGWTLAGEVLTGSQLVGLGLVLGGVLLGQPAVLAALRQRRVLVERSH